MATLGAMFGGSESAGFLGLPKVDPSTPEGDIVIFGADTATPYASVGAYCAGGAAAIREGGSAYAGDVGKYNFDLGGPILPDGVSAVDAGDLAIDPADPEGNRERIAEITAAIVDRGGIPVLLGGDDSTPTPLLSALGRVHERMHILQIDAHIDWRDEVQGEPLGLSSTMRRASELGHVDRIVQVGARGVGSAGPGEVAAAEAYGAVLVPAREVHRDAGLFRALQALPAGETVVVCLDVDALDPAIMPAVIAPTAGGLTHDQVLDLLGRCAAQNPIAAFCMVEFMPEADRHGAGAICAAQLLISALGLIARQPFRSAG